MGVKNSLSYQERLGRAADQIGMDALRGRVSQATIRHENWCQLLKRLGPCNCDPDISLATGNDVFAIDEVGNARRVSSAPKGGAE